MASISPRDALPISELFLWGRVTRAHGLQGHLVVECFSEKPQQYDLRFFWVLLPGAEAAVPHRVAFLRPHTSTKSSDRPLRWWRLRFHGVKDRSEAETWVRAELYLPRAYLPPLADGEFYYVEALGAQVIDQYGILRGKLREIFPGAAYDFFIVENEEGETFWIPAPFISCLERREESPILRVEAPEGLWDASLAQGKS